ncbi:helix-hairpin-helix domain-containing protein [Paenibacillus sp. FSL K6-1566]|uniref:ComEA family DNA-binding protein n=1 Tax=unclassified Paenibacillus TaxID=185978 RepID=UPI0030F9B73E
MRRIPVGWSVSAAALGCVLILFAGGPEKGIQGWQPLNDQLEQAIAANHPEGEAPPAGGAGTRTEASRGEAGSGGQALETKAATEGAPVAAQSSKNEAHSEGEAPAQADADAATPPAAASSGAPPAGLGTEAATPTESSSSLPAAGARSGLINVNTADAAGLMELPGIGQAKAKAIIDYRNQHGAFRSVADLMNVKGIGPKMLEKMKPYVEL